MQLIRRGDTFITHKREYVVFYNDVNIGSTSVVEGIIDTAGLLGNRGHWAQFSGTVPHDSLYYKMTKPKFVFKSSYRWELKNFAKLLKAKYRGDVKPMKYLGCVQINLDKIRVMTDNSSHSLTSIGNELLWRSILDLSETFDSF